MSNDIFVRRNPVTETAVKKNKVFVIAQFMSAGSVGMFVNEKTLKDLNLESTGDTEVRTSVTLQNGRVKIFKEPRRIPLVA